MKFRKKPNAEAQMMMGQIFNEMKTAIIYFYYRHKKSSLELLCLILFLFFLLAAFILITSTIKEKEIAKYPLAQALHGFQNYI
jgi:c-di-AMP phosphodiesterase-like protein